MRRWRNRLSTVKSFAYFGNELVMKLKFKHWSVWLQNLHVLFPFECHGYRYYCFVTIIITNGINHNALWHGRSTFESCSSLRRKYRDIFTKLPTLSTIRNYMEPWPCSPSQDKSHLCGTLHSWSSVQVGPYQFWEEATRKVHSQEKQSWAGQGPNYMGGSSIEEALKDGNTPIIFLHPIQALGLHRGRFLEEEPS